MTVEERGGCPESSSQDHMETSTVHQNPAFSFLGSRKATQFGSNAVGDGAEDVEDDARARKTWPHSARSKKKKENCPLQ